MMETLPHGWESVNLCEIATKIVDGSHNPPPKAETGLPMLSARNINESGEIIFHDYRLIEPSYFDQENRRTYIISSDILLTIVGAIGRSAVVTPAHGNFTIQRSVCVIKPNAAIDSYFLRYQFASPKCQNFLENNAKGTAQRGVYLKTLGTMPLVLPPLAEQKRIVAKLDTLLARIARAREELARISGLVERYRHSFLNKAFSGELTFSLRKKHHWPEWSITTLANVCKTITDGDHQAPPKAVSGIPFITISAMNTGVIDLNKVTRFVSESYWMNLSQHRRAEVGDVLFAVTGSIGICARVNITEPFVFQRHIAILKPNFEKILSQYLLFVLRSSEVQKQGLDVATGTAQLTIPLSGLRAFSIPLPSLEEQEQIVKLISHQEQITELFKAQIRMGEALLTRLEQATLAKAFRGELVPQDPTDEPATDLLARLRAQRAAESAPTKKVRRSTKQGALKNSSPNLLLQAH